MQLKIISNLLIYFLIVFPSYTQVDSTSNDNINHLDSNGQKIGLWIENDGLNEVYYKDGKRNGTFKSYSKKNRRLSGFGEYTNGKRTGVWYYFNENGQIDMLESDISTNDDLQILRDDGELVTPKFKSLLSFYYLNGEINEQGVALYDEDIEIDFYKYGTWKYYDQEGNLLKVEDH
jgi:antitoxin component YwqK of YwqJK toxin-antitoxin module